MISSDRFRRDLGERLTDAVVKEIELKTPFKVVGNPDADSILSARLVSETKRITVENRNDDPRALEIGMIVEVTWLNRRREPLRLPTSIALPPALVPMGQTSTLIPEVGQSVATAQQQAIERLAQQIVSTMEEPWLGGEGLGARGRRPGADFMAMLGSGHAFSKFVGTISPPCHELAAAHQDAPLRPSAVVDGDRQRNARQLF